MSQTYEHTMSAFRSIEKPIRRDSSCCYCHLPATGATKLLSQYDPNNTGFNCTASEPCPVESEVSGQTDVTGQDALSDQLNVGHLPSGQIKPFDNSLVIRKFTINVHVINKTGSPSHNHPLPLHYLSPP